MRIYASAMLPAWLSFFNLVIAAPWIAEITPEKGSYMGGTEVTIIGDGFSPNKHGLSENKDKNYGNWVYFQVRDNSYVFNCPLELTGTNTEKIVCITPDFLNTHVVPYNQFISTRYNNPFTQMKVFVVADGVKSNEKLFTADIHWKTPEKNTVWGKYGYAGRVIEYQMRSYTRAYNQTILNYAAPTNTCQNKCRAIKFRNVQDGKYDICNIYDESLPGNQIYKYELYGDGRSDAVEGGNRNNQYGRMKCKLGGNQIGYSNITFQVTQDYGHSRPTDRLIGTNLYPNDIVSYAKIDSIENSVSGVNGGGILTINGDHFLTDYNDQKTEVKVGGQPCQVISLTMTQIQCKLPAGSETLEDYYPGHRGILARTYRKEPGLTLAQLEAYNLEKSAAEWPADLELKYWREDTINSGVRSWKSGEYGYTSFAPFYFVAPKEARYELIFEDMTDYWGNPRLSDDARWAPKDFNDIWQNSRDGLHNIQGQSFQGQSDVFKLIFSEPASIDGSNTNYYPDHWATFPHIRVYDTHIENARNWATQVTSLKSKSVQTVHNYTLSGSFNDEIQEFEFVGDRSNFAEVRVKYGDEVIPDLINWNNPMASISNAVSSTQGNTCPDVFRVSAGETYFHSFEDSCDLGYGGDVSVVSSFCGSKALRKSTQEDGGVFYMFKDGVTKSSCGGSTVSSFPVDPLAAGASNNRFLCFAYKGSFKHFHANNAHPDWTISYFDAGGNYAEWTGKAWFANLAVNAETLNDWKWKCFDIHQMIGWQNNQWNKEDQLHPAGSNQGGNSWRMKELKYDMNSDIADYIYIDHVTLSSQNTKPAAKDEDFALIEMGGGPIIEDITTQRFTNDKWQMTMKPGACSTGHYQVEFSDTDLLTSNIVNGKKYRKSSWPAGTYITSKKIQASSSTLEGSLSLKYPNREEAVVLDTSTPSVINFVNAFAAAKFDTEVYFTSEPTCESLEFDVKFNRPGGTIGLPEESGLDNTVFTKDMHEEGYVQFRAEFGWFRTAHKKPQVQVEINDMASTCEKWNCDFEFSEAATPEVTSLVIANGDQANLVAGVSTITVQGTNIGNFTIDSPACDVISNTDTEFSCTIQADLGTGNYELDMYDTVNGIPNGLENFNSATYDVVFNVDNVSPSSIPLGGEWVVFTGSSLRCDMDIYTCSDNTCAQKFPCQINQDTCVYNSLDVFCQVTQDKYTGSAKIYINDQDVSQNIIFNDGPTLVALQKDGVGTRSQGAYLTSALAQDTVYLRFTTNALPAERNNVKVMIGKHRVFATGNFDSSTLETTLPILEPGDHLVTVEVTNDDSTIDYYVYSHIVVRVQFRISSLSRSSGSQYGGGLVTINGYGFDTPAPDNLEIKFGENECENVNVISNTEATCEVPSSQIVSYQKVELDEDNQVSWNNLIEIYEGDSIRWKWQFDDVNPLTFKVCEAASAGTIDCKKGGWTSQDDSTAEGDFQKKFNVPGIYYVTTGCMSTGRCAVFLTASIVVRQRPETLDVNLDVNLVHEDQRFKHTSLQRTWQYTADKTGVVYATNVDSTGIPITSDIVLAGSNHSSYHLNGYGGSTTLRTTLSQTTLSFFLKVVTVVERFLRIWLNLARKKLRFLIVTKSRQN